MHIKLHLPSPAMAVACLALFVALGGSGYAATKIARPAAKPKKTKTPSQQSLINAAVSKYLTGHHGQFVGPAGPSGAVGAAGAVGATGATGGAGAKGDTGARGEPGPVGLASQSAKVAGPLTTGSSSATELGGPSVTVNVGPSGLVAYWATATIASSGGAAIVYLNDGAGEAPQMQNSGGAVKEYTLPNSDLGTHFFNGGLSSEYVGPGKHTFTLQFSDTAGTGTFSELELVVIPL